MDHSDSEKPDNPLNEDFLRLFLENQRTIYAYILSMAPCLTDADDIMQETAATMLARFAGFKRGTNFGAWGVTIARYKIMEYHNEKKRDLELMNKALLEQISQVASTKVLQMDDRLKALEQCLGNLNEQHRKLIHIRYHQGMSIKHIAEKFQKPAAAMYKKMSRLHESLSRCITMTLAAWEQNHE
jgi:RNA polymerase sigma-70 factor (ECF subfamily)